MERPAESADRGDDGGREVGSRTGDDAGRERRGVHLVLGVEDHRYVEGTNLALGRPLAVQHRQKALGVGERGIRRHGLETLAAPVVAGNDRRQLRDQTSGGLPPGSQIGLPASGIVERQCRDGSTKHVHWCRLAGGAVDQLGGRGREVTLGELALEGREPLRRRQLTVEQQQRGFLVRRMLGEVGDVVAAVHEDSLVRVDRRDRRLGDDDA